MSPPLRENLSALVRRFGRSRVITLIALVAFAVSFVRAPGWTARAELGVAIAAMLYTLLPHRSRKKMPSSKQGYLLLSVMCDLYLGVLGYLGYELYQHPKQWFLWPALAFWLWTSPTFVKVVIGEFKLLRTGVYDRIRARDVARLAAASTAKTD
jgi:hypothetical protein